EDEHTLRLRSIGEPWFSGEFGDRVLLGFVAARRSDLRTGPVTLHPAAGRLPFRVEVVAANSQGVSDLRFIFDRPLSDPSQRFCVGGAWGCAQELRLDEPFVAPRAIVPQALPGQRQSPDAVPTLSEDIRCARRMQSALECVQVVLVDWTRLMSGEW